MVLPDRPLFVRTLCADESLQEAARVMIRDGLGALFVKRDADSPISGMLTDRDIVRQVAQGCDPKSTPVDDAFEPGVKMAPASASRLELANKMHVHGVRHVLLTDDEGETCGVVSLDDLIFELGAEMSELGRSIVVARRHASGDPEPDL